MSWLWLAAHWGRKILYWALLVQTKGVRVIILRDQEVLLVKTSYHKFWELPGGGVRRSESARDAGRREALEEANIKIDSFDSDLGEYLNTVEWREDWVVVTVAKKWTDLGFKPSGEITDRKFFPLKKLPNTVSPGNRRRLEEYLSHKSGIKNGRW
jgi:8-oxo-dGTP pyrophosphatase MutT (NUDIX family)